MLLRIRPLFLPAETDAELVISVKSKDIKPSCVWRSNDEAVWNDDNQGQILTVSFSILSEEIQNVLFWF